MVFISSLISFIIPLQGLNWIIFQEVILNKIIFEIYFDPFCHSHFKQKRFVLGPTYIRPNPSAFYPKKPQETRIGKELDDMMKKLKDKMFNSKNLPKIPPKSLVYDLYSDRLRACLTRNYVYEHITITISDTCSP